MALTKKQKVAALSVASNTSLIILKAIAGIMSGSISIISEAIHSSMDLIAAIIAYFSVSLSGKPADKGHPYGHGKIENISAVVEGLLIFIAAALIIKEAVAKVFYPAPIKEHTVGIVVMALSAVVNAIVAYCLYKTAKEEDSIALEADALHLKTDIYTSAGVALGLLVIKLTGKSILDPLIALLVAILIIKEACHLCRVAFLPLLDNRLDADEEQPIIVVLNRYKQKEGIKVDFLKTRKAGSQKFIDFHMYFAPEITLKECCVMAEQIKQDLWRIYPSAHIHINIETTEEYVIQQKYMEVNAD